MFELLKQMVDLYGATGHESGVADAEPLNINSIHKVRYRAFIMWENGLLLLQIGKQQRPGGLYVAQIDHLARAVHIAAGDGKGSGPYAAA